MQTRPPQSNRLFRRRTAGSVILLVLVTVLLAAFLLTRFVTRAGTEMLADARAGEQSRLRQEAYSALEATLAVLADVRAIDQALLSPAQGWDRPLERAGYTPAEGRTVEVSIEDESGKLPLPGVDPAALEALLVYLGVDRSEAGRVSDALLVWTREDHVPAALEADGSNYERAALAHQPARRPLRSFGELAAVETVRELFYDEGGRLTPLGRNFQANVSLYRFEKVNLNAAGPAVLAAAGLDGGRIDALEGQVRRQRSAGGPGYFRTTAEAATVLGADVPLEKFGVEASAVRITVTVRSGVVVYRLGAVVAPPGGATLAAGPERNPPAAAGPRPESAAVAIKKLDYPFKVLEIREDVESPAIPSDHPAEHD